MARTKLLCDADAMHERSREPPHVILAKALETDAANHRAGRLSEIGRRFDEAESELFPIEEGWSFETSVAYSFWDGWIDARNHDWHYHPGIAEADWPYLADEIAVALRRGEPITNPVLIARFSPRPPRSTWQRLRDWIRRAER